MRQPRHVPHVPVEVECQAWADFIYTTANTTSLASHPLHLHLGWRRTSRARLLGSRGAVPRWGLSLARSAPCLALSARRGVGSHARAQPFAPMARLCLGSTRKASRLSSPRTLRRRLRAHPKPQSRRLLRLKSSRRRSLPSSRRLQMGCCLSRRSGLRDQLRLPRWRRQRLPRRLRSRTLLMPRNPSTCWPTGCRAVVKGSRRLPSPTRSGARRACASISLRRAPMRQSTSTLLGGRRLWKPPSWSASAPTVVCVRRRPTKNASCGSSCCRPSRCRQTRWAPVSG